MRISDWSSDVCSSDLPEWTPMFERPNALLQIARDDDGAYWLGSQRGLCRVQPDEIPVPVPLGGPGIVKPMSALLRTDDGALWVPVAGAGLGDLRSDWRAEEQTSELQSRRRSSYDVFGLKQKKKTSIHHSEGRSRQAEKERKT